MSSWTPEAKRKKRKEEKEIEDAAELVANFIAITCIIVSIALISYAGYRIKTEGLKKFMLPIWNGTQTEEGAKWQK